MMDSHWMKILPALPVKTHVLNAWMVIVIIVWSAKTYLKSFKMECAVQKDVKLAIHRMKLNVQAVRIVIIL